MHSLVRHNQSAFITGRLIHENFKAVQLTAKLLHRKKIPSALYKIDIAKAFDSLDWTFLLELLRHMGFSNRWTSWISVILSTASTKIIMNGSPGCRICHARGLRQGDPLSPLLFVLAMEALNALIKTAEIKGLLQPFGASAIQERIFLYADDVILFTSPQQQNLVATQSILDIFAFASGLKTNPHKCAITPICCNLEDTARIICFLNEVLQAFPIKYLGIPLSVKKLKKTDLQPLVDKIIVGLPPWKASMLTKAGRTVLVKVKLSAIPVHIALAISLPPWVVQCIDKRCGAFLWRGSDPDAISGGHCLLAWPRVCRPAILGGLGLPDLTLQGYALRMRWLWLKRTDPNRPWSSLPVNSESSVTALFAASVIVQIGNGRRSFFWIDNWLEGRSIADLAPALWNVVRPHAKQQRTVTQGLHNNGWTQDISGALTVQVILDYLLVREVIREHNYAQLLDEGREDRIIWKRTADGHFSTASAYRAFFMGPHAVPGAKVLTKTRAPGCCKFFCWLALHDRCWTGARRKRHNLQSRSPISYRHVYLPEKFGSSFLGSATCTD